MKFNVCARSTSLFVCIIALSGCHDHVAKLKTVCLPQRIYTPQQQKAIGDELIALQKKHIPQSAIDQQLEDYVRMQRDNIASCGEKPENIRQANKERDDEDDTDPFAWTKDI